MHCITGLDYTPNMLFLFAETADHEPRQADAIVEMLLAMKETRNGKYFQVNNYVAC